MKTLHLKAIILACPFLFAVSNSQANIHVATTDSCKTYSAKAVYQFRSQKAAGCGFSGLRWNADGAGQHHWCRTVRPIQAENETKARAKLLMKCLNPSGSYNPNDMTISLSTLNNELNATVYRGATERMQQLIAAGANFTSARSDLMSSAISYNKYKTITFLRRMGEPLSTANNNPLHDHLHDNDVNSDSYKMLRWLLQNGVNPNKVGTTGNIPLKKAINYGNDNIVLLLLQKGANPNIDIKGGNCSTVMPLDYAIDQGNDKIIKLLRRYGAKSQAQCSR